MPTIDELRDEMFKLRRDYQDAERRYHNALIEAHPFKVGDIIRSSRGTEARILRIGVQYDKVRITAVLRNKDGKFGQKMAPMWRDEWDNPELIGKE